MSVCRLLLGFRFVCLVALSLLSASLSASFDDLEVKASGLRAWTGDYNGLGAAFVLSYPIKEKHFIELEGDYIHLVGNKSQTLDSFVRGPRSGRLVHFKIDVTTQSTIDEYFTFVNYKYASKLGDSKSSKFSFYVGAGLGLAYFDMSGNSIQRFQKEEQLISAATRRGIDPSPARPRTTIYSSHFLSGAGQVFAGLGYSLSDNISVQLGCKTVFTNTVNVLSPAKGVSFMSTEFAQYMIELGVGVRW